MIGVVIVGHGALAREYLAAIEHVVGKQKGFRAVCISAECDRKAKQIEICEAANSVDCGKGVVLVADLYGSSPMNLSKTACSCSGRRILYGANLPMLLKLAKCRHMPLDDAIAESMNAGKKYMNFCSTSALGEAERGH